MTEGQGIPWEEERHQVIDRIRSEVEKRTGKTPEQLLREREKRITDAIQLKVPDRVPLFLSPGKMPLRLSGLPMSAPFYDQAAFRKITIEAMLDFIDADVVGTGVASGITAFALEQLKDRQILWPGGPLRPDQDAQFIDMEIMKGNEYDLFITDPGDFMMRCYLPRRFEALAPLAKLPPFRSLSEVTYSLINQSARFGSPDVVAAFETLFKVGQEQAKMGGWGEEISNAMGFPRVHYPGGAAYPPYDLFTYLRGMHGLMIDLVKRPEKVLLALDKGLEWQLARAIPAGPGEIGKRVYASGCHYMSEEFLSKKQFARFVWPTWKKALIETINMGFIPVPFMEGKNDDRLEYFLELPKGKAFLQFERIDIVRAKEILGGHLCIVGGVPGSLLWGGSPQEVEDYCRKIIKICGKNGGFILAAGSSIDDAKPENVAAMIHSVKKYGQYD